LQAGAAPRQELRPDHENQANPGSVSGTGTFTATNIQGRALDPTAGLALRFGPVRWRVLFVVLFFGLELAGIAWGQRTPDHVLGFQMFNESSRLTIHLFRELEHKHKRILLPVPRGRWQAPDASGTLRDYAWQDRVRYFPLNTLDRSLHAPYGISAQLFHLQAALEDVASHIPADTRTLALVAEVETLRNFVPGPTVRLRAEKP